LFNLAGLLHSLSSALLVAIANAAKEKKRETTPGKAEERRKQG
jgi:hypothetical protein